MRNADGCTAELHRKSLVYSHSLTRLSIVIARINVAQFGTHTIPFHLDGSPRQLTGFGIIERVAANADKDPTVSLGCFENDAEVFTAGSASHRS